jgi:hypothetical protein
MFRLLQWFRPSSRSDRPRAGVTRRRAAPRRCRPRLEALEDRLAPAVLTVNTTSDNNDPGHLGLTLAVQVLDLQNTSMLTPQQLQQVSGTLGSSDQIRFAPGLAGTITLAQGELVITRSVVIAGPGAANLTIDAHQQSRAFGVYNPGINVTLDGLTITGGVTHAYTFQGGNGGGVYNGGNLTVHNCTLSGNSAEYGGGGIYNAHGGALAISNCTLWGNTSPNGGGIYNGGMLTVSNSTLFGNTASLVAGPGATASVNGGGALFNVGTATLKSVTVTGNSTDYRGGAVNAFSGTLLLHNTIVAGNISPTPSASPKPSRQNGNLRTRAFTYSDIVGTVDGGSSFNLIGTGGSGGLTNGVNANLVGVSDSGLGLLATNGGPTQTCAVLVGSPALGAGDPSLLGTTDQRGVVRTSYVNIGAYQDPLPNPSGGDNSGSGSGGHLRIHHWPILQ